MQKIDPLRDLVQLQNRMNQLFEDATERRARGGDEAQDQIDRPDWVPPADVYEEADAFLVVLDLPGVDRSALEIDLENERLAIRGVRSINHQSEARSERPRGKFVRVFSVPASIDQERIEAEYKDGVLAVRLPKRTEQPAHRVEIKVS